MGEREAVINNIYFRKEEITGDKLCGDSVLVGRVFEEGSLDMSVSGGNIRRHVLPELVVTKLRGKVVIKVQNDKHRSDCGGNPNRRIELRDSS